jgi:hypothetical protein
MTSDEPEVACCPFYSLSRLWANLRRFLCGFGLFESNRSRIATSKSATNPVSGRKAGRSPTAPHVFYTHNQLRLGFAAEQSIPFLVQFKANLQSPDRLILLAVSATSGHLLAKYNHFWISLLVVLFAGACYRTGRRLQKRGRLQNCLRFLNSSSDGRRAFLARIGAPSVQKLTQERAEWLNDLLSKCWPFINSLLQNKLDRRQPDLLGDVFGAGHGLWLERFTLGDRPPAVCYISAEPAGPACPDELTVELKVLYAGNCVLTLSRRTALCFAVRAGVRDVSLRANARLRLRPLLTHPPFIGGCAFSLLDRPALDYEGVQLANLADNRLIKSLLVAQVGKLLLEPNALFLPFTVHPELTRRLKAPQPIGLCVFQVIEADNLQLADRFNPFLNK